MRLRSMLVVALALAGLVACRDMDGEEDAIEVPDRPAPVTRAPGEVQPVATPRFEAMGEGHVTGLVRLYPADEDGFTLEVILDGLPEGEYAWHIVRGSCDEPGEVVVPLSAAGDRDGIAGPLIVPAEPDPARGAATIETLTLEEARSGDYTLHVREWGGHAGGATVACADLSGEDNATM